MLENSADSFDVSGTVEEYWTRALERIARRRRSLDKRSGPDSDLVWVQLERLLKLEAFANYCLEGRTPED